MSAEANTNNRLFSTLDATWAEFNESYAGLSDEQMQESGVVEGWSVRDLLAHINTWEEECLKHLPLILEGGRPPLYTTYGGLDAFNAQMTEAKRELSLAEVRERLEATHRQIIDYVGTIPAEQIGGKTRSRKRLRLDTYGHYPLHAEAIRDWRQRKGY